MDALEKILTNRLPLVEIRARLPLVEKAEMSYINKGKESSTTGYVCGYCNVDVGPAILFGDCILDGKVFNSGEVTIKVKPIKEIKIYCLQSASAEFSR